ncbi:Gfo/Idh/MocA family oxidoreductase [Algoriphagus sp.]|uniref:Gfo/Idh/MocA family oxidoreductase n=1 Tax=Algoriphagus sp. TaxID=1872435 RepID=UPI0026218B1F|nr:Gfo/Idh/MocA family oxidoreductase [Algoriphagus sp.]
MELGFNGKLYHHLPNPYVNSGELALEPIAYVALMPSGNSGISYTGSKWRKIWNYFKVYRPIDVIRKSFSRSVSEKIRNDKWMVAGLGKTEKGLCWFFHPSAQNYQSFLAVSEQGILEVQPQDTLPKGWANLADPERYQDLLKDLSFCFPTISGKDQFPSSAQMHELKSLVQGQVFQEIGEAFPSKKEIQFNAKPKKGNGIFSVLFGYGNYARTITLPYLNPHVRLAKIHEIDPALLLKPEVDAVSTSPLPDRDDFAYPVWLIAGFHHTHAGLAEMAINHGIIPVIEKPVATNWEDYERVLKSLEEKKTPFYQCFQKRYQIFNDFIFEDLAVTKGEPINFKATVFEIPLNEYHWYNWPVSGSRIISNGCHWIDHFLYINDYPDWTDLKVFQPNPMELTIQIVLSNGAFGVISLSDVGSNRIGMREYVEFTVSGKRAYIQDSMRYESESNSRILRSYRTDKLAYLRKMYDEIGRSIQNKEKGDELKTLKSTKLSLELEDLIRLQLLKPNDI